jgi:hypothetical protein
MAWDDYAIRAQRAMSPRSAALTQATRADHYDGLLLLREKREEIMPRELTHAEINAVSGGQANNVTINESTTATPTSGTATLNLDASSGIFAFTLNTAPGLATIRGSARQSGS